MPSDATRDALLAAIVAEPEDDVPRLVFADWCDEHGDPARAEFIRVQCRLAGMNPWDEGYVEAKLREQRLFWENWESWVQADQGAGGGLENWRFILEDHRRGFPDQFNFSDEREEDAGCVLLARLPLTRAEYSFRPRFENTTSIRLLGLPELSRLRELTLTVNVSPAPPEMVDATSTAVANHPHLANLRRLVLCENPPTPAALARLLAARHLRGLIGLAVWGEEYHDEHARALAAANLPDLLELRLGRGLTAAGAAALARARWFPHLTHLDLTANERLGDAGLTALLAWGAKRIRSVQLWNCNLGARAWAALADAGPPSLVSLSAGRNQVLPRGGLAVLGQGRYRLEALDLSSGTTYGREDDLAGLFDGPAMARLRRLDWDSNCLDDDGFTDLVDSPLPGTLRFVSLAHNWISEAGITLLLNGPPWPHLAHLDLTGISCLAPATALALVEHPNFARVVSLGLPSVDRSHVFVKRLAASPAAARLRSLHLRFRLTSGATKAIAESSHL
jgi:uncharacterized protein (TIGR02996 family)